MMNQSLEKDSFLKKRIKTIEHSTLLNLIIRVICYMYSLAKLMGLTGKH